MLLIHNSDLTIFLRKFKHRNEIFRHELRGNRTAN